VPGLALPPGAAEHRKSQKWNSKSRHDREIYRACISTAKTKLLKSETAQENLMKSDTRYFAIYKANKKILQN